MANLRLDFGARALLSEEQLKTIQWLRNLGAKVGLKKNRVTASFSRIDHEQYCRVVSILGKEAIAFQLTE